MEHLRAGGWRTLTLDELLAGHASGEWPARSLVLTFDDGFRSFAEHGLPVLASCGFSAIVFVVAGWVGRTSDWPGQPAWAPRSALLDWADLRAVADASVEIGGHTLTHTRLTSLAWADAEREILGCRSAIEDKVGRTVRAFAYPYGEASGALESVVASHFHAGFGTRLGFATRASRTPALDRIDAYYLREQRFFRAIESGWLGAYLGARRWARALRRMRG